VHELRVLRWRVVGADYLDIAGMSTPSDHVRAVEAVARYRTATRPIRLSACLVSRERHERRGAFVVGLGGTRDRDALPKS
jgi:hypothetical protein